MNSSKLDDRTILITGAGGCLGSAAALALAAAGAQLILLDKLVDRLEVVSDQVLATGGKLPALYPLDLTGATEHDFNALAEVIGSNFGHLTGLLHGAAELGTPGPLEDVDAQNWDRLMKINLGSAHALTRALLPLLRRADREAAIVFTGDASARTGCYFGAYGVAKWALEGMARVWADELSGTSQIRIHLFLPGPIDSTIRRRSHAGEAPESRLPVDALAPWFCELFGPAGVDTLLVGPGAPNPPHTNEQSRLSHVWP